jgi:hypothetical protein
MATNNDNISSQIFKSRDQIRNQITTMLKSYLELENVDLTKSSFLSFLVEILSTLTSNVLFYQLSTYREFFLTKAQLPSSIYNLAAFLGYKPAGAKASNVNLLFTFPFTFQDPVVEFTIKDAFKVTSDSGIEFRTYYSTAITITNNSQVRVIVTEGNKIYNIPVDITSENFSFVLPFSQYQMNSQEFQIAQDLKKYQFVSLNASFAGQVSTTEVQVKPPGSAGYETYTQVSSLFLMDAMTKGYVKNRTDGGIELQFGNGLIGYQPNPGSNVLVTNILTNGLSGNVISGSIKSGERLYTTTIVGVPKVVQYNLINTSSAFGGHDEESIEQTRQNSIASLTTLKRLVTENDYINANVVIENSPIGQNSLPVLKRSDLKVNEISLFSTLNYLDKLVPTRDFYESFTDLYIPRETVLTDTDGSEFYTVFDMQIDPLNSIANYTYILKEIQQIPSLVTSYGSTYNLYCDLLKVRRVGNGAEYQLNFKSNEVDSFITSAQFEILETGYTQPMVNDTTSFIIFFPDYNTIPKGELTYYFTIAHAMGLVGQYQARLIFRNSLEDFTMSDVVQTDSSTFIVYDIPTISKDFYNSIDQVDFELNVFQTMLTTMTFKDYRMLTDFVSFKFANTTGLMKNMQLNEVTKPSVIDILSIPPLTGVQGDRYIVENGTGSWVGKDNQIATLFDSTGMIWVYTLPKMDDLLFVSNRGKKYIYGDLVWVIPEYTVPLQIEIEVVKSTSYSGSLPDLANLVRQTLVEAFTSRFGINTPIFRSEIIEVIQGISGVDHCNIIKPESNIFINFNLKDLTQEELLRYGPEYMYFTIDNITVRIF